jgi:hypothetical protein
MGKYLLHHSYLSARKNSQVDWPTLALTPFLPSHFPISGTFSKILILFYFFSASVFATELCYADLSQFVIEVTAIADVSALSPRLPSHLHRPQQQNISVSNCQSYSGILIGSNARHNGTAFTLALALEYYFFSYCSRASSVASIYQASSSSTSSPTTRAAAAAAAATINIKGSCYSLVTT